jgi:hypothetical protein
MFRCDFSAGLALENIEGTTTCLEICAKTTFSILIMRNRRDF